MVNATITDYSEKLGLYQVTLQVNDNHVASATGNGVEVTSSKMGSRYMVALLDNDGIGIAFFHCDTVEDKRCDTVEDKRCDTVEDKRIVKAVAK
jgi:hypothetical protein